MCVCVAVAVFRVTMSVCILAMAVTTLYSSEKAALRACPAG